MASKISSYGNLLPLRGESNQRFSKILNNFPVKNAFGSSSITQVFRRFSNLKTWEESLALILRRWRTSIFQGFESFIFLLEPSFPEFSPKESLCLRPKMNFVSLHSNLKVLAALFDQYSRFDLEGNKVL